MVLRNVQIVAGSHSRVLRQPKRPVIENSFVLYVLTDNASLCIQMVRIYTGAYKSVGTVYASPSIRCYVRNIHQLSRES